MKSRLVVNTMSGYLACHGTVDLPVGFVHRFDKDPFAALYVLEENGQFWLYRAGRPGRLLVEVVTDESLTDLSRYAVSGLGLINIVDGVMFVSAAEYVVDDMWRNDLGPSISGNAPQSDLAMGVETGRYRITFHERLPSEMDLQIWPLDARRMQRWSLIAIMVAANVLAIWSLVSLFLGALGTDGDDWMSIGSSMPFQQFLAASLISAVSAFALVQSFQGPSLATDRNDGPRLPDESSVWSSPDIVIVLTRLDEVTTARSPSGHALQS